MLSRDILFSSCLARLAWNCLRDLNDILFGIFNGRENRGVKGLDLGGQIYLNLNACFSGKENGASCL